MTFLRHNSDRCTTEAKINFLGVKLQTRIMLILKEGSFTGMKQNE
jgi:hypothetical protein